VDGWRDSCTKIIVLCQVEEDNECSFLGSIIFVCHIIDRRTPFFSSPRFGELQVQETRIDNRCEINRLHYNNKAHKIITANIESVSLLRMSTVRKYQCMCGAFEAQVTGEPVLAVSIFCACRCDGYHSGWCRS
jgi:hypothetical protein